MTFGVDNGSILIGFLLVSIFVILFTIILIVMYNIQ